MSMRIDVGRLEIYLDQQIQLKTLETIKTSITHQAKEIGGRGEACKLIMPGRRLPRRCQQVAGGNRILPRDATFIV